MEATGNDGHQALVASLQASLAALKAVQAELHGSIATLHLLQARWAEVRPKEGINNISIPNEDPETLRRELEEAIEVVKSQSVQEKALATQALEVLNAISDPQDEHVVKAEVVDVVMPSADAALAKRTHKKRKIDAGNMSQELMPHGDSLSVPSALSISTSTTGSLGDSLASSGTRSARASPNPPTRAQSTRMQLSLSREGISPAGSPAFDQANPFDLRGPATAIPLGGRGLATPPAINMPLSAGHAPRNGSLPPSKDLNKKERRAAFTGIYPYAVGRKLAFLPPKKGKGGKDKEQEERDWIIVRVVDNSEGDRGRYTVQDIEDEDKPKKPGAIYTAFGKSILPLPDPSDRSTYPIIPVGADVLALWPETTTLYKAKITSLPGSGRNRSDQYKVVYEDDNGEKKNAPVEFVIDQP